MPCGFSDNITFVSTDRIRSVPEGHGGHAGTARGGRARRCVDCTARSNIPRGLPSPQGQIPLGRKAVPVTTKR
jgi:hypothetical protein